MAGHLLDSITRGAKTCGLCLGTSGACQMFLIRNSAGGLKINPERSTCPNLGKGFRLKSAAASTRLSPCTNHPLVCPECGPTQPAVWKYSLEDHLRSVHPRVNIERYRSTFSIDADEIEQVQKKFSVIPRGGAAKRKHACIAEVDELTISEAHTSRVAFRYVATSAVTSGLSSNDQSLLSSRSGSDLLSTVLSPTVPGQSTAAVQRRGDSIMETGGNIDRNRSSTPESDSSDSDDESSRPTGLSSDDFGNRSQPRYVSASPPLPHSLFDIVGPGPQSITLSSAAQGVSSPPAPLNTDYIQPEQSLSVDQGSAHAPIPLDPALIGPSSVVPYTPNPH